MNKNTTGKPEVGIYIFLISETAGPELKLENFIKINYFKFMYSLMKINLINLIFD